MERKFVLDSHDYFMSVAFLTALRSEDPSTKVGACIVNKDEKIVGLGYNKSPGNVSIPWNRVHESNDYFLTKYPYVLHAEMSAILNKTCDSLQDCTMYSLVLPYNECAKVIIESGIKKLIYYVDKYSATDNKKLIDASKRLFFEAKIEVEKFQLKNKDATTFFENLEKQTVL